MGLRKLAEMLADRIGAAAPAEPKQTVVTYQGEKAMRKGIAQMERQGWHVVATSAYQPRAGIGRIALLGLGAAVIKPKGKIIVTFARE